MIIIKKEIKLFFYYYRFFNKEQTYCLNRLFILILLIIFLFLFYWLHYFRLKIFVKERIRKKQFLII
jgi:hypothetical protein